MTRYPDLNKVKRAGIAPEETLRAFRLCVEDNGFDVDYFEFDLQYWTINNKEDAEYLMSIGADAIITD